MAQCFCKSLRLIPRPSIQRRRHLFLMNCVIRIASSIAAYCALLPSNLYSYISMSTSLRFICFTGIIIHQYTDTCQGEIEQMSKMIRTNLFLTPQQKAKLDTMAEHENSTSSELARRAIDAFLAWYDPSYNPEPKPQTRNGDSSPV